MRTLFLMFFVIGSLNAVEPVDRVCAKVRIKFADIYGQLSNASVKIKFYCDYKKGWIDSVVIIDTIIYKYVEDETQLEICVEELCRYFPYALYLTDSHNSFCSSSLKLVVYVKKVGWMHAYYTDIYQVFKKHGIYQGSRAADEETVQQFYDEVASKWHKGRSPKK